ncbi:hypothetical protein C8R46DRAFT_1213789 [Mycena filopes]|nr:hypothetical protein C8R46DRAFT_1213789 [Mycena filopes]
MIWAPPSAIEKILLSTGSSIALYFIGVFLRFVAEIHRVLAAYGLGDDHDGVVGQHQATVDYYQASPFSLIAAEKPEK